MMVLVTNIAVAIPQHTNFLPMEDSYYPLRGETAVYGADITAIKPYRQAIVVDNPSNLSGNFMGSTDILICVLLFGVYFAFTHKRSQTRNIDL
jgi:hypothetical protein